MQHGVGLLAAGTNGINFKYMSIFFEKQHNGNWNYIKCNNNKDEKVCICKCSSQKLPWYW